MDTLRYLIAVVRMNIRELGALRMATAVSVLFMLLNNLVFFSFWMILYQNIETIRGVRIEDVAFMFSVAAASFGIAVTCCGGVSYIAESVTDGKLDIYLTQPRDLQLQLLTSHSRVSGWGDLLSALLMLGWYFGADPYVWGVWAAASIPGAILFVVTISIFQSVIFWVPRSEKLSEHLFEFLLSFTLYPQSIFSWPIRALTYTLLPAAFISFLPMLARRDGSPWLIAICIAAALGYLLLSRLILRLGVARYESGSSFTQVR